MEAVVIAKGIGLAAALLAGAATKNKALKNPNGKLNHKAVGPLQNVGVGTATVLVGNLASDLIPGLDIELTEMDGMQIAAGAEFLHAARKSVRPLWGMFKGIFGSRGGTT